MDEENESKVVELRQALEASRNERHKLEIAKTQFELSKIQAKNDSLLAFTLKLTNTLQIKMDSVSYASSTLNALELKTQQQKEEFIEYKNKVDAAIRYASDYAPGYAEGVMASTSGKAKLEEIAAIENKSEQIEAIELFVNKVVKQTFDKTEFTKRTMINR